MWNDECHYQAEMSQGYEIHYSCLIPVYKCYQQITTSLLKLYTLLLPVSVNYVAIFRNVKYKDYM